MDDAKKALDAYVDNLSMVLDLHIEEEWRDAVLDNMRTIAQAAHLIMSYPIGDHDEAAPVFRV